MNEIETKRIVHRIKKSKSWFFEQKTGLTELQSDYSKGKDDPN